MLGDLDLRIFCWRLVFEDFSLRELSNADLAIEKFSKLAQNHSKFSSLQSLHIILHPLKQKKDSMFWREKKSLTTTPRKPGWQSVLQPVSYPKLRNFLPPRGLVIPWNARPRKTSRERRVFGVEVGCPENANKLCFFLVDFWGLFGVVSGLGL